MRPIAVKLCTNIPYNTTFHFLALTLVQFRTYFVTFKSFFATLFKICLIIMLIYAVFRAVPIPLAKNDSPDHELSNDTSCLIVHYIFAMKSHSKSTVVAITEICPAKVKLGETPISNNITNIDNRTQ